MYWELVSSMDFLDKIVDDILDPGEPRRNRRREDANDDKISIGELLGSNFYKEDIQSFCEDADLRTTGTKDELIEELLTESDYNVTDYLEALEVGQLKDICEQFDEKISGTKNELIQRIVPHIELKAEPVTVKPRIKPDQQTAPSAAQRPPEPIISPVPQPPAPPILNVREDEIRRAHKLEYATLYGEAIELFRKYELWENVKRCMIAQRQAQTPQTYIVVPIDRSIHSAYSDNRNISNVNNIDNREAVINRPQFGGNQPVSMKVCPYCGLEFNLPEPPPFCPRCTKQLL